MKKSRVVLCFTAAGLAAVVLLGSGCRSRQPAANLSGVSVLGAREILPPPYSSPAMARALPASEIGPAPRVGGEPLLPSALTGDDAFVPAVGGEVAAPLAPSSLDPVLVPAAGAAGNAALATPPEPLSAIAPVPAPSALSTPLAPTPAVAPKRTYKVKSGDSLSSIGYCYGVSWPRLAALNGMDGKSILKPGMVLRLPDDALETPRQLQKKASAAAPASAGGKATTTAKNDRQSSVKKESRPANGIYKVRSGDNLWVIARRFDCTSNEIRTLNNLSSDLLQVGQELKIPEVGGSGAAASTAKGAAEAVNPAADMTPGAAPKPVILEAPGVGPAPAVSVSLEPKPVVISPTGGLGATPTGVAATDALLAPPPVPLPLAPTTTTPAPVEQKLMPHNLGPEETLQIVADMYSITIAEILRLNPGVKSDADLKGRTQIMVPVKTK